MISLAPISLIGRALSPLWPGPAWVHGHVPEAVRYFDPVAGWNVRLSPIVRVAGDVMALKATLPPDFDYQREIVPLDISIGWGGWHDPLTRALGLGDIGDHWYTNRGERTWVWVYRQYWGWLRTKSSFMHVAMPGDWQAAVEILDAINQPGDGVPMRFEGYLVNIHADRANGDYWDWVSDRRFGDARCETLLPTRIVINGQRWEWDWGR